MLHQGLFSDPGWDVLPPGRYFSTASLASIVPRRQPRDWGRKWGQGQGQAQEKGRNRGFNKLTRWFQGKGTGTVRHTYDISSTILRAHAPFQEEMLFQPRSGPADRPSLS